MSLPATTHLGSITLTVRNLKLVGDFYQQILGLPVISNTGNVLTLGYRTPLIILQENTTLPYPKPHEAGLYHLALLYTSPGELTRTLLQIFASAPEFFQGPGDHLVSQAFYLNDPEGNGIELYIDRPREQWTRKNGVIQMATLPIDIEKFIAENQEITDTGTISLGHVHLKVGDSVQAKDFYVGALGFDEIFSLPNALFVSAGGYHHHIGVNSWESIGALKRSPSLGLQQFEIILPNRSAVEAVHAQLIQHNYDAVLNETACITYDPWGTKLCLL